MLVITNDDLGKTFELPLYTFFIVEISYNPTTGVRLTGPTFEKVQNAIVIKDTFVSDNPVLIGSPGKQIYLMMTVKPIKSDLFWFFTAPDGTVSEFKFTLDVKDICYDSDCCKPDCGKHCGDDCYDDCDKHCDDLY